jgi:hypothetical protein
MMQIAKADTYENYVVCRGYDTRDQRHYDYDESDADKNGIPVAKPYGNRVAGLYQVGQVFPAILPIGMAPPKDPVREVHLGQNPGKVESGGEGERGHPSSLAYKFEHLKDEDGKYINWLLLDTFAVNSLVELCLAENHPGQGVPFDAYFGVWDSAANDWDYNGCQTEVKAIDHRFDVPQPEKGATGLFTPRPSDEHGTIYECVSLDCSADPDHECA